MRTLILYAFTNHNQLINDLRINLNASGVLADSLNIVTFRMKRATGRRPILVIFLSAFLQIPKLRGLFFAKYRTRVLLRVSNKYDIIDIHYLSSHYDNLVLKLKERGKKVKITIWGSDFYRADSKRISELRDIFRVVDTIQFETEQVAGDFLEVFSEFEGKIAIANFGIDQLGIIDHLLENEGKITNRNKFGIPRDSVVVTCGTNGSEAHQHLEIIRHIDRLPPKIKEKLFLLFPMNYGGKQEYISEVESKLKSMGLPYLLLTAFLPKEEFSRYVVSGDIVISIQKSDSLSSTILEYLYANGILLAGEWLPYQVLSNRGIGFITVSMETIGETIAYAVENIESLKKQFENNSNSVSEFSSWNKAIPRWVDIYRKLELVS
jgi:glycosyltransferase involved in cell wall biosynthesis